MSCKVLVITLLNLLEMNVRPACFCFVCAACPWLTVMSSPFFFHFTYYMKVLLMRAYLLSLSIQTSLSMKYFALFVMSSVIINIITQ